MIADCSDDFGDFFRRHPHRSENMKSHQGAALGMVHPIDAVPDIMQKSGDLRQLHFPLRVAEIPQNFRRNFGGAGHVGKGMLGVSVSLQSNRF